MLCEKCQKNVATFHYTEVVNGVKNEHHLCSSCAANTDVSYYSSIFDNDMHFTKLLSGLLGAQGFLSDNGNDDPAVNVACPKCGMTYGEFIASSRFGCSECYDVFGPLIAGTIKKIQGSDRHTGKKPMLYKMQEQKQIQPEGTAGVDEHDIAKEIDFMTKKLKEAVAVEDYAEAARLRDAIAELKGKEQA